MISSMSMVFKVNAFFYLKNTLRLYLRYFWYLIFGHFRVNCDYVTVPEFFLVFVLYCRKRLIMIMLNCNRLFVKGLIFWRFLQELRKGYIKIH